MAAMSSLSLLAFSKFLKLKKNKKPKIAGEYRFDVDNRVADKKRESGMNELLGIIAACLVLAYIVTHQAF
jgi:hypothetical protein